MRLGEGKKFIEDDWKRQAAYALYGELHIPVSIRLQHVLREVERPARGRDSIRLIDAGCNCGNLVTYLGERPPGWTFCALELDAKRIGNADKIRQSPGRMRAPDVFKRMTEFVFRRLTQQDLPEGAFARSACSNRPTRPNMPNEKKQ